MSEYREFLCNIYDPDQKDAIDYIVNKNLDQEKREKVFSFIKYLVSQTEKGLPKHTNYRKTNDLIEMGIIGLYKTPKTPSHIATLLRSYEKEILLDEIKVIERENINFNELEDDSIIKNELVIDFNDQDY